MNLIYYEKAFGKSFPRHNKSVAVSAKELMKKNGSWDDLEYIASHVKDNYTFYFTFSRSVNTEFYSGDKIDFGKISCFANMYVTYENTTAIIAIRYLKSYEEIRECIKLFKGITVDITKEKILESIKKLEEKWPILVCSK